MKKRERLKIVEVYAPVEIKGYKPLSILLVPVRIEQQTPASRILQTYIYTRLDINLVYYTLYSPFTGIHLLGILYA